MNRPIHRSGEFEWIAKYLAPLAGNGAFGLQDDAALLPHDKTKDIVITQDAILESIHFFETETADVVARKALRVNVSDLIAKGATPKSYSLALGIPDKWTDASMGLFAEGLARDQKDFSLQLTGGDTFRSPDRLSVAVTMIGEVEPGRYISRIGARPGDLICTTGTIGDAALGLWIMKGGCPNVPDVDAQWLIERHKIPRPPVGFQSVVSEFSTASMDISDGLLGDLAKLCKASNVGSRVEMTDVPLSLSARELLERTSADKGAGEDIWRRILAGGDDYQTLFTIARQDFDACADAAMKQRIIVSAIGEIAEQDTCSVSLLDRGVPRPYQQGSYAHF